LLKTRPSKEFLLNISGTLRSSARTLIILGVLAVSTSACTSLIDSSSSESVPPPIEGSCHCEVSTKSPNSVHLRIGFDELTIDVRNQEDFNVRTHVRPDGMISIPRVGDIDVAGKTLVEVKDAIAEKLQKIIRDPIVTVSVTVANCEGGRVRVTGAVKKAISIQCRLDMTVLSAVRRAGGVTEVAVLSGARLYRRDGSFLRIRLDHVLEGSDMATNYVIRAGDVLTVPRKPSVH